MSTGYLMHSLISLTLVACSAGGSGAGKAAAGNGDTADSANGDTGGEQPGALEDGEGDALVGSAGYAVGQTRDVALAWHADAQLVDVNGQPYSSDGLVEWESADGGGWDTYFRSDSAPGKLLRVYWDGDEQAREVGEVESATVGAALDGWILDSDTIPEIAGDDFLIQGTFVAWFQSAGSVRARGVEGVSSSWYIIEIPLEVVDGLDDDHAVAIVYNGQDRSLVLDAEDGTVLDDAPMPRE